MCMCAITSSSSSSFPLPFHSVCQNGCSRATPPIPTSHLNLLPAHSHTTHQPPLLEIITNKFNQSINRHKSHTHTMQRPVFPHSSTFFPPSSSLFQPSPPPTPPPPPAPPPVDLPTGHRPDHSSRRNPCPSVPEGHPRHQIRTARPPSPWGRHRDARTA